MSENLIFYRSLLDSTDDQITVIDSKGDIVFVNRAWRHFANENGFASRFSWLGANYLQACNNAAENGDSVADLIAREMHLVLKGEKDEIEIDYPSPAGDEQRWFTMLMRMVRTPDSKQYIITHRDITARKLAEVQAEKLSLEDALTGIANRRALKTFLNNEWRRCERSGTPLSLIMIDADYFKQYNDDFGHAVGDEYLRLIASAANDCIGRPTDLAARFGGEEFVIVLGQTDSADAFMLAEKIRERVLADSNASGLPRAISVSLGISTVIPGRGETELTLIENADKALYLSKQSGRNQTQCFESAVATEELDSVLAVAN